MADSPNLPPALELACGCVLEDSYLVNGKQRNKLVRPCRVAKMIQENVKQKKVSRECLDRHIKANAK